jgi:hypothetical protein
MCTAAAIAGRGSNAGQNNVNAAKIGKIDCGGRESFSKADHRGPNGEYIGNIANAANLTRQRAFFKSLAADDNGEWALEELRRLQQKPRPILPHAPFVGFKWKPLERDPRFFTSALARIARCRSPRVKVVYNRRNVLDRHLSTMKHAANQHLKAHCKATDNKCLQNAAKAGTGIMLDTDTLLNKLRKETRETDEIARLLKKTGVTHLNIDYDRLFHSDRSGGEWERVLHFLKISPSPHVTLAKVLDIVGMAATSPHNNRTNSIGNYGEVRDILMGTEFESILYE